MALNINTIKQASPKANQVATEQYVDTSIAAIDVSSDISSNNDIFAQKLGYLNYASMVAASASGQTIINGGYVNTSLLQANSINAGMINTVGLIAENISANEIVGKTMTGSIINGAAINGAVIKASYLDLDGELEVLTNYHITPAMYAANTSLYTDAVYLSGNNEYRIPSISTVHEEISIVNISNDMDIFNSKIRSYNCGNAGHNNKCVKIIPNVNTGNFIFLEILYSWSNTSGAFEGDFYQGSTDRFEIYFAGNSIGIFYYDCATSLFGADHLYRNGSVINPSVPDALVYNFTNNGFDFSIEIEDADLLTYGHLSIKFKVNDSNNSSKLTNNNFDDSSKGLFYIKNLGQGTISYSHQGESGTSTSYSAKCYTNQNIYINNMI